MRLSALFPWTVRRLGIFILVFGTLIQQVCTVPHAVYVRQTPLSLLKLPECALRCFVNHIIDDSCAIITDFACHCGDGTLLDAYSKCLAQHCDQSLRDSAINSLRDDCGGSLSDDVTAVNGTTTVDDDPKIGSRNATSTSSSQLSSTTTNVAEPTRPSESNSSSSVPITSTSSTQLSTMVQTTIVSITTTETSRAAPSPPPQSTPTTTTEVPLAPLAQSTELSHAARAGIGVSVAVVASVVTVGLGWYIRRLKRQLYAAQEVIITTTNGIDRMDRMDRMDRNDPGLPAPPPTARTRQYVRSWLSNNTEPISPISAHPRPMEEGSTTTISNIGYGMVLKKRGDVLSILVEREGEGDEYAERSVREPVPGQREGLTSPLELDGIGTGLFEMPISVTPRRSIER